jgi:hypothetical protein
MVQGFGEKRSIFAVASQNASIAVDANSSVK